MSDGCFWPRLACRVGAAFDALMIVPMLSPRIAAALFAIGPWEPGPDYRYAMAIAASLMLGWSGLLLWADRRPAERRAILLLTAFPVIPALAGASVLAVSWGFIPVAAMIPTWCAQTALEGLLLFGFAMAGRPSPAVRPCIETLR